LLLVHSPHLAFFARKKLQKKDEMPVGGAPLITHALTVILFP
jgi:hypothetical protein